MIRPVVQVPDPILHQVSAPIDIFDAEMRKLSGDLLDTMRKHKGLGLAAVQIGAPVRMIAVNQRVCPFAIMVNPVIAMKSGGIVPGEEGCLSINMGGRKFPKARHYEVVVDFTDRADQKHRIGLKGLSARVIQHEIDHLDGKLVGL